MLELGVVEVAEHRLRRGFVHRLVVMGVSEGGRLLGVALNAALAANVGGLRLGWEAGVPIGKDNARCQERQTAYHQNRDRTPCEGRGNWLGRGAAGRLARHGTPL